VHSVCSYMSYSVRAGTFHATSGRHGFQASTIVSVKELSVLAGVDEYGAALLEAWSGKEEVLKLVGEVTEAFENMAMVSKVLPTRLHGTRPKNTQGDDTHTYT